MIKDQYTEGECPDCGDPIPDDMEDGGECKNCGHVFYEQRSETWNLEYPPESVIMRNSFGVEVRTRAAPGDCDYIRIVVADARAENEVSGESLKGDCEIVYWDSEEWQEDPVGVMGAIMGAMRRVAANDPFEVEFGYKAFE